MSGEPKSQVKGISLDEWKAANYQSAGLGVTIERDAKKVSVTGPVITETESISTTTQTYPWKGYKMMKVAFSRMLVRSRNKNSVAITLSVNIIGKNTIDSTLGILMDY